MYICAPCIHSVPVETRRGHWVLWDWSYRWLGGTMWVLEPKPGSSENKQPGFLTAVSSFQPHWSIFLKWCVVDVPVLRILLTAGGCWCPLSSLCCFCGSHNVLLKWWMWVYMFYSDLGKHSLDHFVRDTEGRKGPHWHLLIIQAMNYLAIFIGFAYFLFKRPLVRKVLILFL